MKVQKTETRMVAQEVTTESYTLCDKCDQKITKSSMYDSFVCALEYKEGADYPEGGSGTVKTVDLCQSCAEDLMTLLRESGYRINEDEWDW